MNTENSNVTSEAVGVASFLVQENDDHGYKVQTNTEELDDLHFNKTFQNGLMEISENIFENDDITSGKEYNLETEQQIQSRNKSITFIEPKETNVDDNISEEKKVKNNELSDIKTVSEKKQCCSLTHQLLLEARKRPEFNPISYFSWFEVANTISCRSRAYLLPFIDELVRTFSKQTDPWGSDLKQLSETINAEVAAMKYSEKQGTVSNTKEPKIRNKYSGFALQDTEEYLNQQNDSSAKKMEERICQEGMKRIPDFDPMLLENWVDLVKKTTKKRAENRIISVAKGAFKRYKQFRMRMLSNPVTTLKMTSADLPENLPEVNTPKIMETYGHNNAVVPSCKDKILLEIKEGIPGFDPGVSNHWAKLVRKYYPAAGKQMVWNVVRCVRNRYFKTMPKNQGKQKKRRKRVTTNPENEKVLPTAATTNREKIMQLAQERMPVFNPTNDISWRNLIREVYPMLVRNDIREIAKQMKVRFFRQPPVDSSKSKESNKPDILTEKEISQTVGLASNKISTRRNTSFVSKEVNADEGKKRGETSTRKDKHVIHRRKLASKLERVVLRINLAKSKCTYSRSKGEPKPAQLHSHTIFGSPGEEIILHLAKERHPRFDPQSTQDWLELTQEVFPFNNEQDNKVIALKLKHRYFRQPKTQFFDHNNQSEKNCALESLQQNDYGTESNFMENENEHQNDKLLHLEKSSLHTNTNNSIGNTSGSSTYEHCSNWSFFRFEYNPEPFNNTLTRKPKNFQFDNKIQQLANERLPHFNVRSTASWCKLIMENAKINKTGARRAALRIMRKYLRNNEG